MTRTSLAVLIAAAVLLSACGSTTTDRAISGGGIGAGIGAGTAAVTGGNVLGGAAIGGAAGAAGGALTKQSDVDLGKPLWKR